VIIHLYNSTSPAQRRVVSALKNPHIVKIATRGTQWIKERLAVLAGTEVRFEYSPESFSGTEVEFSLEICEPSWMCGNPHRSLPSSSTCLRRVEGGDAQCLRGPN